MTGRRTQTESEQPAKVYQLDAVESKVNDVLLKLDTVISQTKGVVTLEQLETVKKDISNEINKKVAAAEQRVGLKYDPMQDNLKWFIRAVIGQGVVMVGGIIFAAIAFFGPKG